MSEKIFRRFAAQLRVIAEEIQAPDFSHLEIKVDKNKLIRDIKTVRPGLITSIAPIFKLDKNTITNDEGVIEEKIIAILAEVAIVNKDKLINYVLTPYKEE